MKTILIAFFVFSGTFAQAAGYASKKEILRDLRQKAAGLNLGVGCPGKIAPWSIECKDGNSTRVTSNDINQVAEIAVGYCAAGQGGVLEINILVCDG